MEGLHLANLHPNDRLEPTNGSTVRVVAESVAGHHLIHVEYEESRRDVFAAGERNLVYPHEIARGRPR